MVLTILELIVTLFIALLAGSYFGTSLVDVPAQKFLSAFSYVEIQQAATRLGTIRYRALVLITALSQLGLLLVGEFVLRVMMVLTLPTPIVLAVSPIVFNVLIFGGVVVSAVWARSAIQHIRQK